MIEVTICDTILRKGEKNMSGTTLKEAFDET